MLSFLLLFLLHCSWRETRVFRGSTTDWKSDQIIYIVSKEKYKAICVMDIDGQNVRELYRDYSKALQSGMAVSKDGKWLAFLRGNKNVPGTDCPYAAGIINLLNLNDFTGRDIERKQLLLMSQPHYSWSPTRNQIAYTDFNWNVYIYDAETETKRIVVAEDSSPLSLYLPRWSPDGKRIAGVNVLGIYVIDVNNPVPVPINDIDEGLGPIEAMCWLSEQELLFSYEGGGLFKINVATGEKVSINPLTTIDIALSPDRQLIAAVQDSGIDIHEPSNIYVMKIDGSDHRNLAEQKGWNDNFNPCWSTDGTYIVFASTLHSWDRTRSEIYIMDADGQNQKRLTFTEDGNCYNPTWVARRE
ncbi:PD40 domain-containing protein [candidate division WOR-3 bacterium]|nr:PD40 domain-containing protein [candidate division WOR-3 bacterium]